MTNPLSMDHYAYLNQLLNLEDDKKLAANKEIQEDERTELINQAKEKLQEMEARTASSADVNDDIVKLRRALEILQNEEKRRRYDAALAQSSQINLEPKNGKNISIVPLVPIENIINEFKDFKREQLAANPLLKDSDFKYEKIEGPPTVHKLYFPDEESMNQFLARLFKKDMAMLPNGSQNIEDVKKLQKPAHSQSSMPSHVGSMGVSSSTAPKTNAAEKASGLPPVPSSSPRQPAGRESNPTTTKPPR